MCRIKRGEDMIITEKLVEVVLNLLQVPRIKEAIQKICSEGMGEKAGYSSSSTNRQESSGYGVGTSMSYSERDLRRKNDELAKKVEALNRDLTESQSLLRKEQSRNETLQKENGRLLSELDGETNKRKEAESRGNELDGALAKSKSETRILAAEVKKLRAKVEDWENTLGRAQEAFNAFLALSEYDRDSLENVFREEELTAFIATGAKWESIETIWDYARYEFNQGRLASREKLLCMLRFFLDVHNSAFYAQPKYQWQEMGDEEEFDSELYDKTPDSRTSGIIQKVLLPGIVLAEDPEEVVKKSLTKV